MHCARARCSTALRICWEILAGSFVQWPETDKSMEEMCCQGFGYPPVIPGRLLSTLCMPWTLTNPYTASLLGAVTPGRMALPKETQGWLGWHGASVT